MARKKARPEDEAFLASIIETPDDDAPRLVYADWLEEHGQSEADRARAEFIREQIRLDREGASRKWESSQGSQRLNELYNEHRKVWEQGLPPWAAKRAWYRRGFIERVSGTERQWLKDGARVRRLAPIRRLRLDRLDGLLPTVASAGLLSGLKAFNVYDSSFTPEDLTALAECADLNGVAILALGRCRFGPGGATILARGAWLAGVEKAYLAGNELGPEGARALAAVPFRGLKDLNLHANDVGDEGLAALVASPYVPNHLAALNLCYNRLGPAGARALAGCAALRSLKTLHLTHNDLGDDGARALAASPHLAGLKDLELRETRITDAGAAALAASPHLSGLTKLELYDNPIMGEGIFALLDSPHLKGLADLSVFSPRRRQDPAALQAVRERFDRR